MICFGRPADFAIQLLPLAGAPREHFDIEAHLGDLGIPVQEIELSDDDLDGGSLCDDAHGPVIFLNRRSLKNAKSWGRRMTLAHELCHLLFDRRQAVPLAIVSGPWAPAPIERRANAFAAELLLPLAGLRRHLSPPPARVTDAQVNALMDEYEVGLTTCVWHLKNRQRSRVEWGE